MRPPVEILQALRAAPGAGPVLDLLGDLLFTALIEAYGTYLRTSER